MRQGGFVLLVWVRVFFFVQFFLFPLAEAYSLVHRVEEGETLFGLARRYQVSVHDLAEWNHIDLQKPLLVGQSLEIKEKIQQTTVEKPSSTPTSETSSLRKHTLAPGETLRDFSSKNQLNYQELFSWNSLEYAQEPGPGDTLIIEKPSYLQSYSIQRGESLSVLAQRFHLSTTRLRQMNALRNDYLLEGQKILYQVPPKGVRWHYVLQGQTPGSLATFYDIPLSKFLHLNRLQNSSILQAGTLVRLLDPETTTSISSTKVSETQETQETQEHLVLPGETLYSIAKRYGVLIEELVSWNRLRSNSITAGRRLLIYPRETSLAAPSEEKVQFAVLSSQQDTLSAPQILQKVALMPSKPLKMNPPEARKKETLEKLSSLVILDPEIPLYEWNGDFYYWRHPQERRQPSRGYFESWNSPLNAYKKSRQLFENFEEILFTRPRVDRSLEGLKIILDPGHGGLDPGAIVKSKDGNGKDIYITEDEYVYDFALRLYVLLRERGADVALTILAPDHLIRDTTPATNTLIHVKNEVYNSYQQNKADTNRNWVLGTRSGLNKRIQVASEIVQEKQWKDVLFLSLHADNNSEYPQGVGFIYQDGQGVIDKSSSKLAAAFVEKINVRAYHRGQDLHVLRENPFNLKLLIELRNVAYEKEAWALRFSDMRQKDAERLVQGLVALRSMLP